MNTTHTHTVTAHEITQVYLIAQILHGSFRVIHHPLILPSDLHQPLCVWLTKQRCISVFGLLPAVLISIVGVVDHVATNRLNWSLPAYQDNVFAGRGLNVGDQREACQAASSQRELMV